MKKLFPFQGKTVKVTKDMCDFNGHMNVNHIKKVFEQGWEFAASEFGINEEHFANGFSSYTLEDNYRFKKEFLEGQLIHPYFRLYNVNEKLFHLIGALFDDDNNICAMYETVEGHVDMSIRKIAPMPHPMITNMLNLKEEHSSMGEIPYDIRLKIKTYKE